jgi:hypothetical protein
MRCRRVHAGTGEAGKPKAQHNLTPELLTPHARSGRRPFEFMQISRIAALEPFACWRD